MLELNLVMMMAFIICYILQWDFTAESIFNDCSNMKEKFIVLLSVMVFITRIQKAVTQCSSPPIPVLTSQSELYLGLAIIDDTCSTSSDGAAISIRCPINGVYDEIKWKKNGKFLNTSPTKYSTTPADPLALTVMNVDTSDAGTYGCMTNGYDCLAATLQVHLDSTVGTFLVIFIAKSVSTAIIFLLVKYICVLIKWVGSIWSLR